MRITRAIAVVIGVLGLLVARGAAADVEVDWGAFVENDLRLAVDRVDEPGVYRNQTTLGANLKANLLPDRLRFVGDLRFAWTGFTKEMEFAGLSDANQVSPYYLESRAAYIEVYSLLPGLDLRLGRQVVNWGAADMFNPTNNLNALDLEDPLRFGDRVANEMIRLDWMPGDNFIFTAVWVPVFQPALLPGSSLLAIGDPSAEFPYVDPEDRLEAERLRNIWLSNEEFYEVEQPNVRARMPRFSVANSQFAVKAQWLAGLFDMSLSYYQGRNSMPVTLTSVSSTYSTGLFAENGTPILGVASDVTLVYPRKKVVGFDLAGQLPFLADAGAWFEGAFVFPEAVKMSFDVTEVAPGSKVIVGDTVSNDPYFQCTAGMDYTFNEHVFVTGQFVHGMVDEFGAHAIGDYWVGGFDLKFLQERLLVRVFALGEIPKDDKDLPLDDDNDGRVESFARGATDDGQISSYVLLPQMTVKPINALELTLGAYFLLGHKESKFAQAAAGPSLAFFQAKAMF